MDVHIETPRLILRPPLLDDLPGWKAMMSDVHASRFIGGPLDETASWASLAIMAGAWQLDGFANFSILLKETGTWIGRAGPWMPDGWPGPEIGWALLREHWGRGYAREAAQASMDWVRTRLGWDHVIHIIHPQNGPSIALAEALGSSFEYRLEAGELDSETPLLVFGQRF